MPKTKTRRDWGLKVAILAVILLIAAGILTIAYFTYSRGMVNEYKQRVSLALQAAIVSEGLHVQADDGWHELDEEAYRKLTYYLTLNANHTFSRGDTQGETISLRIGSDPVTVVHAGDGEEKAVVTFETADKTFRVTVQANKYWPGIREAVGEARYYLPEPAEGA